jgi:hypothetical protein
LNKLESLINNNPGILHQKVENFDQIPGALRRFSEYDIEFLVINGGDGTVHNVLTSLFLNNIFERIPTIVLLKGGSANMIPNEIGLKGSPVQGLKELLAYKQYSSSGLKFVKKDILRIEYSDQGQRVLYGMFFGTGLIYQAVKIYQKSIRHLRLSGSLNPILTGLYVSCLLLIKKKKYLKVVTTNLNFDKTLHFAKDNYFFLLTTLNKLLLGVHTGRCFETDKIKFMLLPPGIKGIIDIIRLLCRFNIEDRQCIEHRCVKSVAFSPCAGFIVDGEIYESLSVNEPVIVSSAGCLHFLTNSI